MLDNIKAQMLAKHPGPEGYSVIDFKVALDRVRVYNRTPGKASALIALGAKQCDNPAEVTEPGGVVVSLLWDGTSLKEVVQSKGFLDGLGKGGLHISMSTVAPEDSRQVAAWQLGAEIALARPEFLEFSLDWTAEAAKALPENPVVAAQRAEALTLNNQAPAATPLWEMLWRSEPEPRTLAALILCETAAGRQPHAPNPGRDEEAASMAFVQWYQKLITVHAKPWIEIVNGRLEPLARVLPTAAQMLQNALSESDLPVGV